MIPGYDLSLGGMIKGDTKSRTFFADYWVNPAERLVVHYWVDIQISLLAQRSECLCQIEESRVRTPQTGHFGKIGQNDPSAGLEPGILRSSTGTLTFALASHERNFGTIWSTIRHFRVNYQLQLLGRTIRLFASPLGAPHKC